MIRGKLFGTFIVCMALLVSAIALPNRAAASRVTPMIVEMEPTGRNSIARIELTNDADRDIAYEVQMMSGEISPEGELTLTPADDQFVVFPPQAIVEGRSQQVFRVQYVGDDALEQSKIYYLSIKQIPVAFQPGQNQVQVVVNFNVLINVVPDGAQPLATIRSAQYVEREISLEGVAEEDRPEVTPTEKGIAIDLGNDGTRYFFAGRSNWSITAKTTAGEDFALQLGGIEMSRVIGTGVVAPGKNRLFFIPTDAPLDNETLSITVDP